MSGAFKRFIKKLVPPIILRGANLALRPMRPQHDLGSDSLEKGPEWYDQSFESNDHWRSHYTASSYYFLWSVIADRISFNKHDYILEIGCGSGQLAALLRDKGLKHYFGFDFSEKRIAQARLTCPDFSFAIEDAFKTGLFSSSNYSAVICTEFLEHVEGDLEVINRIKPGAMFYGTVPNFPFTSHVRHFSNEDQVLARYGKYFANFRVDSFLANDKGKTFYLLEGKKL